MDAITGNLRTQSLSHPVFRRAALRGFGGAAIAAALAAGLPSRAAANGRHRSARALFAAASGDDPAAVIDAYVAAVNAGDLEGILALHDDDAVHIFLPTADGSPGVCRGKGEFRMWYEQSLANGDRIEIEPDSLVVDGNQATFVARLSSDPWRALGVETLSAQTDLVLMDGRIMTHIALLTPESARQLQTAREASAAASADAVVPHGMHSPW
jgi:hypothetical protein